ncbi:DNA repair protein RadA [Candidatus Microgenomates bacterium]|nr:MAG: DNA repair protein RadA [Candidatus Microgenomates bacterium]
MKKTSTSFVCQECGYDSPQWLGKCPECNAWNSFREFQTSSKFKVQSSKLGKRNNEGIRPKTLDEIEYKEKNRISTGFSEMDNVLGGGIVTGSVTLLAGDPGVGKSTLLLQTALNIASAGGNGRLSHVTNDAQRAQSYTSNSNSSSLNESRSKKDKMKPDVDSGSAFSSFASEKPSTASIDVGQQRSAVLYISGEESEEQIKLRAKRIVEDEKQQKNLFLMSLSDTDEIVSLIEKEKPSLVVIDSIQTMESENMAGLSGSVGQVRYSAGAFIKTAKTLNIPVIIIGHVTKEGMVAGPMVLSHMVDTVLFLEGEKITNTRILRSFKNRFGPIDEVGIFSMDGKGINEVNNPEKIFLDQKIKDVPGSVLVAIMEGTRTFLIEIQALVVYSKLPFAKRVSTGIDSKRLELLIAVLQKHCRLPLETVDVFVNVAGGIKISDRAVDLGVCLAIFSSLKNIPLSKIVGIAEIGLLGELRNVPMLDKRVKQAKKLGFDKIISAQTNRYLSEVINSFK